MATIEDLEKLDIRIVKVLQATPMEGSEKLLKLIVDIGGETRQILSGIAKSYSPEDLVGKELTAIVNLETRKMMGEESQGMVLATGDNIENISLLIPQKEVEAGSKIR
jgi:methionine--tRNA ligase beta chain